LELKEFTLSDTFYLLVVYGTGIITVRGFLFMQNGVYNESPFLGFFAEHSIWTLKWGIS
jgi:hypothetical protein